MNQTDLGFRDALGENLNFAVKTLGEGDEPERKIEFLHGTTTLAFKVSSFSQQLIASGQFTILVHLTKPNNHDTFRSVSFIKKTSVTLMLIPCLLSKDKG